MALVSHASLAHFVMNLLSAAPASGLPSFPTALLRQPSSAAATPMVDPSVRTDTSTAKSIVLMCLSLNPFERTQVIRNRADFGRMAQSPCFPDQVSKCLDYANRFAQLG